MIATSTDTARKHGSVMLRRSPVQATPPNTLAIQSITSYGADKARINVDAVVEGDMWSGCKIKVTDSTNHDGIWTVISVNFAADYIVAHINNAHNLPDQAGIAGTVILYDAVADITVPGNTVLNYANDSIAEKYAVVGSFVCKKAAQPLAIQFVIISGSNTAAFQASLDGITWSNLNITSLTASGIVFINDMPEGTMVRINVTGTGTYYLLARG